MNPEGVSRLWVRRTMADGPFPEHYEPFESPSPTRCIPKISPTRWRGCSRATWRSFGDAKEFPYRGDHLPARPSTSTSGPSTSTINAVLQPEMFVEICEELAKEKGIRNGGWVRGVVASAASIKAKAVVTKRIRPLKIDGKTVHTVGLPIHFGFIGETKKACRLNSLTPSVGDANTQTPEYKAFLVDIEPHQPARSWHRGRAPCHILQSALEPPPQFGSRPCRRLPPRKPADVEVAKLIDVSKCIGCKACQAACMEWNDLREEIGVNAGVYDNPHDLTPATLDADALHRVRQPETRQSRVADPQGRLHALRGSGLPQGLPGAGRDRAVLATASSTSSRENCIGCGYCVKGCPFNIPRISKADNKAYKCTLCSDRVAVGQGPACAKACPTQAIYVRHQGRHDELGRQAHRRT